MGDTIFSLKDSKTAAKYSPAVGAPDMRIENVMLADGSIWAGNVSNMPIDAADYFYAAGTNLIVLKGATTTAKKETSTQGSADATEK